jgi:hypothetical protein
MMMDIDVFPENDNVYDSDETEDWSDDESKYDNIKDDNIKESEKIIDWHSICLGCAVNSTCKEFHKIFDGNYHKNCNIFNENN